MDTNEREFLLKQETFDVVGCAMEVLNTLGHGLFEKPYERALAIELAQRAIPFVSQPRFEVSYKGEIVGQYIPDLIAFDAIIIEVKCVEKVTQQEIGQVLNYLRLTKMPVGVLLNFRRPKLEWQRVIAPDI